jgi:hypothetical protein
VDVSVICHQVFYHISETRIEKKKGEFFKGRTVFKAFCNEKAY